VNTSRSDFQRAAWRFRTFDDFDFRIEYYRRAPQVSFDFIEIVDTVETQGFHCGFVRIFIQSRS